MAAPRVAVVADDLIWSTRLREQLGSAGARAVAVRGRASLEAALPVVDAVVVDLTARAYDGIELVGLASSAARRVVAVAQHDDREGRRAAIEAGAERVFVYRQLAEDGGAALGRWLASGPTRRPPHGSTGAEAGR